MTGQGNWTYLLPGAESVLIDAGIGQAPHLDALFALAPQGPAHGAGHPRPCRSRLGRAGHRHAGARRPFHEVSMGGARRRPRRALDAARRRPAIDTPPGTTPGRAHARAFARSRRVLAPARRARCSPATCWSLGTTVVIPGLARRPLSPTWLAGSRRRARTGARSCPRTARPSTTRSRSSTTISPTGGCAKTQILEALSAGGHDRRRHRRAHLPRARSGARAAGARERAGPPAEARRRGRRAARGRRLAPCDDHRGGRWFSEHDWHLALGY